MGNTQTILKSDLKSRQKLINEFSQNTATAVENIDGILAQIEKNEQLEKEKARKNRYKKENDKEIKTTITIGITEKKENYLVVRNIFSEAEVYGADIQSIGDKAEKCPRRLCTVRAGIGIISSKVRGIIMGLTM